MQKRSENLQTRQSCRKEETEELAVLEAKTQRGRDKRLNTVSDGALEFILLLDIHLTSAGSLFQRMAPWKRVEDFTAGPGRKGTRKSHVTCHPHAQSHHMGGEGERSQDKRELKVSAVKDVGRRTCVSWTILARLSDKTVKP